MLSVAPPPHLVEGTVHDVRLALEVIAAVFAVRAYRRRPAPPSRLACYAFLCLAVPHLFLLLFTGVVEYFPQTIYHLRWIYWLEPIAVFTFLILMILSLQAMLYEPSSSGMSASNQSMQPTVGRRTASRSDD